MYLIVNEYYTHQNIHLGLLGIIGYLLAFFMPDIDTNSKISNKLPLISWVIQIFTKHRGFTHSLLALIIVYNIFAMIGYQALTIGATVGYASHLITDLTTHHGITLFWPIPFKVKIPIINKFTKLMHITWILILMYILTEYEYFIIMIQKLHF